MKLEPGNLVALQQNAIVWKHVPTNLTIMDGDKPSICANKIFSNFPVIGIFIKSHSLNKKIFSLEVWFPNHIFFLTSKGAGNPQEYFCEYLKKIEIEE